jgi:hypothetical protein
MDISEAALSLVIDAGCREAIELLALLTLMGYCTTAAMKVVADSVRGGLVLY